MSWAQTIAPWHDFYAMAGTAAATFVGLLFVALSLRGAGTDTPYETERGVWALAQVTFTCFLDILLMALVFLVPAGASWIPGLALLALGLLASAVTVGAQVQMRRSFSRPLWRIAALPVVGYLGQMGVALALGTGQDAGLPWLAVVVVLLLLLAAYLCWGLLREPILGRVRPTVSHDEGPGA